MASGVGDGDADADLGADRGFGEVDGCGQCCGDSLGDGDRVPRRVVIAGSRMANSSPPSRATVAPGRRQECESLGDDLQELVADVVPERVVDLLEPVQVQQQHRGLAGVGG